tara:strand:+ start:1380 stop:2270 length:891 start_codon:yes stop_codon:yes gene_type:complete
MSANKPTVGFIGLGLMGQGATKCLTRSGYTVTGFDIDPAKNDLANQHGVTPVQNAKEVAIASDVILVCVMTPADQEAAIFADDGATHGLKPNAVLVDHSTTPVDVTKAMAARLKETCGVGWIDAPVSGGPEGAEAGELAIMAGGSHADITKAHGVMETLASKFTVFGDVGAGQVAKMVNQILVLNNYAIIAEALALAEAGGIDTEKIPEALASGHAGSNLLPILFPRMIERDFEPRGRARQILKDYDTLHDLAKTLKTPTPMSAQATSLFRMLIAKGGGELDGSAILKLFEQGDID